MGPRWRSYFTMKEETKKSWYAVYTKPRWEKKVNHLFQAQGIESYCPLNRVRKKWSDRMKWVEEPLFKSYVFVRINLKDMTRVRMVDGVLNFVYWLGKPALVKDVEIEDIRRFMKEYSEVEVQTIELKPDMPVLIRTGVLMDKEAKVKRVLHNNAVEVVIESLGFVLLAQVEKSNVVPIRGVAP
jgi:transcription antitermination factor NusG